MARRKKKVSNFQMFNQNGLHKITEIRFDEDGFELEGKHIGTGKKYDVSGYV